ncbi:MAG: hypothetical protein ACIAQU_12105, partial [Phycisphaerales bacterium JB064]
MGVLLWLEGLLQGSVTPARRSRSEQEIHSSTLKLGNLGSVNKLLTCFSGQVCRYGQPAAKAFWKA